MLKLSPELRPCPGPLFESMAFRYLAFNKPFQVLCQFTAGNTPPPGEAPRLTLADFIPVPHVYPVGRLDFDSEGLVLLSDDGGLQHCLSDPRFGHTRTYWVQVEGTITEQALTRLRTGVIIQDYRTKPCQAALLREPAVPPRNPPVRFRKAIPTSWLELSLTEGRNRQVRRMTAAVGFPTLRLIRIAIGTLRLNGLEPGTWRGLTPDEVSNLLKKKGGSIGAAPA